MNIKEEIIRKLLYKNVLFTILFLFLPVEVLGGKPGPPPRTSPKKFKKPTGFHRLTKLNRWQIQEALEGRNEEFLKDYEMDNYGARVREKREGSKRKKLNRNAVRLFSTEFSREESLKFIEEITQSIHISKEVERILLEVMESDTSIKLSLKNLSGVASHVHVTVWPRGIQTVIWFVIDLYEKAQFLFSSGDNVFRISTPESRRQFKDITNWLSDDNFSGEGRLTHGHRNIINRLYKRLRSRYEEKYPLPLKEDFKPHVEPLKVEYENLPLEFYFPLSPHVIENILDVLSFQVAISGKARQALEEVMSRNRFIAETLYDVAYDIQYMDPYSSRTEVRTETEKVLGFVLNTIFPVNTAEVD